MERRWEAISPWVSSGGGGDGEGGIGAAPGAGVGELSGFASWGVGAGEAVVDMVIFVIGLKSCLFFKGRKVLFIAPVFVHERVDPSQGCLSQCVTAFLPNDLTLAP